MSEQTRSTGDYRFQDWRYLVDRRLLIGPESELRLKPLLDRLLRQLLDAPGRVLPREYLIDRVWTRRLVNDEVLSRAIAELRSILGDDAREPRYIETLPKGGYRWIAATERQAPPQPSTAPATPGTAASPGNRSRLRKAIALVLLGSLAAFALSQLLDDSSGDVDRRATLAVDLLDAQPLTADPKLEYDARFDPLGRVVYVRSAATGGASELMLVDPTSLAERVLWTDAAALRHPAPSPDGREIAVARHGASGCEIWIVALVDARRTRLGECAGSPSSGFEWVEHGQALLFTGPAIDALHAPGLVSMDRKTGNLRALTTPLATEGAHVDPRVSVDAGVLVYSSTHGDDRQLWRTDWPRIGPATTLLERPEPIYAHAFESGSDTLWIAGDLTLYRALHRLVRGGRPELVGGRGARSVDISGRGSVVWSQAEYDADIWLRRNAESAWIVVARSTRYESQPEFSADGRRIALVSNRNGTESVLVHDLDTNATRQLVLDPGRRWVRPTWSARDSSLILTAYEDHLTRLYRYRLEGDVLTPLDNVESGAFHGTELSDRLLYMTGHGTARSALRQLRVGSAQSEDLGLGVVSAYRAAGSWVAWCSPGTSTLHLTSLNGAQPTREFALDTESTEAFALDDGELTYRNEGALWRVLLPDGEPARIDVSKTPNGSGPSLATSSSGAIALVTLTSLSMDLFIAEVARPPR